MKLKLRVEKFEKAIAVQVLEMDERFRNENPLDANVFKAANFFFIESGSGVRLCLNGLQLRGHNHLFDCFVATIGFKSNDARNIYLARMRTALKEWASDWEGWKEEPVESGSVWEF